jgi:hypothetical protein
VFVCVCVCVCVCVVCVCVCGVCVCVFVCVCLSLSSAASSGRSQNHDYMSFFIEAALSVSLTAWPAAILQSLAQMVSPVPLKHGLLSRGYSQASCVCV